MDSAGRWERINRSGALHFGVDALYEPKTGGSFTVRVVFRSVSVEIDPETNMPVKLENPVANVEHRVLPQNGPPLEDDCFTVPAVGGTKYVVKEPPSDEGEGTSRVVLRKFKP